MRRACLPLLPEWPHELSDRFLVEELNRPYVHGEPHPFTQLLGRVRRQEQPLAPAAAELLAQRLPLQLIHSDWRASSRAIELSRGLEPAQIVPHLIESLAVWDNRESLGRGSRRITEEIMRELQRRSGRTMGRNPARWNAWWQAVQDGTIELATEGSAPAEARTSAQFFGLRPITDRVTFVIDRSGSMEQPWGTTNHSRYEEAVEQMLRFLQACGPRTRFNVVLFSSSPIRSSRGLVEATDTNLESARSSILGRAPDGGTFLRPAIQTAMAIGSDGLPELERLEADTIVVLCDGETEEGAAWVGPFLERANALARVRFHCVLIGSSGDGTLEALAERTGGDFIRTGG